ncbi:PAS domain S-box protein [Noviherbaspirillum sp. CPCC 100848]|uniref:histidine kinase n=1 Tax=Noviherbaspirillum album TaxID=3080276 RepID=A0ABU6JF58_9BURK|nr:PAS domain S-box protein [Noviherbaspirillum sp. CPCC 100848]MEC4722299.1 PAS domain S-box protein [Noviherbaspirillum sp. CPCC 100848]
MNELDESVDTDIAKQQLAIFRRAAKLLASSLNFEQTLGNVILACLPALGDYGFFDVVLGDGVRRTVRAHLDPEIEDLLRPTQWVRQTRTDMNLCALSSGEPALHADIDDAWYRSVAADDDHLALLRRLACRSMLSVPMRFGNELVGSLTLFMGRSGRRHSAADADFAMELAALAAPVVVNVRLLADDLGRRGKMEKRLRLLDAVSEATRSAADPKTVMEVTARMVGEQMEVTRCAYADLEPDNDAFTIRHDWAEPGVASTAGTYSLDLFGPRAASDMRQGRTLVVHDVDAELEPGEGADMFNAIGIKAIICCPLVKEGRLVAMMAVHNAAPRLWHQDEIALLEDVVERCWAHIERVRSTEALRASESHLSSLFEQSAVGIAETDTEGRLVKVNGRYCELLGRSRDSILGRHLSEFTHAEDVSRNMLLFERLVATGESFEIEKRYLRQDGTALWCSVSASLIQAAARGQSDLVMAVVLDITERRRAEELLLQTAGRLQFTLEAAAIGAWDFDLVSGKVTHTLRHSQCFGYEELLAEWGLERFYAHVHPDDRDRVRGDFDAALRELRDWHCEFRVIWPDGSVHWLAEHGAIHHDTVRPTRMSGIVFDITESKRAEDALRASERRALEAARQAESERRTLDALLEAAPVGIVMADTSGKLLRFNSTHRNLWGGPTPRTEGIVDYGKWRGWWADGSERHGEPLGSEDWTMARVLRGEPSAGDIIEIEPFGDHGDRRIILTSGAPVRNVAGEVVGGVIAQIDVTDRVRAEEALRQSDRRKDEFLAMLAHELRNPLAPIASAAELLRLARTDEERVRRTSEVISRQVEHITGLVDDLLDVSRVTRGLISLDLATLNMADIIADAVEQVTPLIESRRHRLAIQLPEEPAYVQGDNKRLVQVLTNLLNNAAKYTPEGGDIAIGMELGGNEVTITVRDNGIGMSPELRKQAFELFAQAERSSDRSQGGLGIGLALVRSLLNLHGGRVTADSAGLGRGSLFTIRLPQAPSAAAKLEPVSGPAIPASGQLRVLIVDDNVDAATMLGMFVETGGHEVFICNRPESGLERAQQVAPHICFIDIGLPGMDGYEMARRLRQLPGAGGPVLVALTGYGQPQDRVAARDAGFDHHFVKPMDMRQLSMLLADVASRQGGEATA